MCVRIILIAFPWQQWFRERACVLRYTYIACLVTFCLLASARECRGFCLVVLFHNRKVTGSKLDRTSFLIYFVAPPVPHPTHFFFLPVQARAEIDHECSCRTATLTLYHKKQTKEWLTCPHVVYMSRLHELYFLALWHGAWMSFCPLHDLNRNECVCL
jgi:hypothetical protein